MFVFTFNAILIMGPRLAIQYENLDVCGEQRLVLLSLKLKLEGKGISETKHMFHFLLISVRTLFSVR